MKKVSAVILMVFLFISLFKIRQADAINIMGAEITWTCAGNDSFLVTLTYYSNCNETHPSSAKVYIKNSSNGSVPDTIDYNSHSEIDITPICKNSCNRCTSSACSFPYGIKQLKYQKLVVLKSTNYGCDVIFYHSTCCRESGIKTGSAGQYFYIESRMNRCLTPVDNSPSFSNPPIAIICVGQDFQFNFGVVDIDLDSNSNLIDSISYEWTSPLKAAGTNTSWNGSYTYDKPTYFWGFPNTKLPFPRGLHLDPKTGDLNFRPMKVEQTVMAIKVIEWRNIKGTITKIGEISRDMQFIIISCPNNHAPVLGGPFYKDACIGDTVTFSIATNDYDSQDTLTISYHGNLPDANWSSNNLLVKHPTGTLKWIPGNNMANANPYVFTVSVEDDACPTSGRSTRAYSVFVQNAVKNLKIKTDSLKCDHIKFTASNDNKILTSYNWEIRSKSLYSTNNNESFTFHADAPGIFYVKLKAGLGDCASKIAYDTVKIDTFLYMNKLVDSNICLGDTVSYLPKYFSNKGNVSYNWSNGSNKNEIKISPAVTTTFYLAISDTFGCVATDSFKILVNNPSGITLGPDRYTCSNEYFALNAVIDNYSQPNDSVWWKIHRTGQKINSNYNSVFFLDSGIYSCYVKNRFGCKSSDTIHIHTNPMIKAFSPDIIACMKDTILMKANSTGSKTSNVIYKWYEQVSNKLISENQDFEIIAMKSKMLRLAVFEKLNGISCSDEDVLNINVLYINSEFKGDLSSCAHDTNIDLWKLIDTGLIKLSINHPSVLLDRYYNPSKVHKDKDIMRIKLIDLYNSCSIDTFINFKVLSLPSVKVYTLYGLKEYCSEYGMLKLLCTPSGGIYGGKWYGYVDSGYYFNAKRNPGIYPVIYQFKDNNGCVNSDTFNFTIAEPDIYIDKNDLSICTNKGANLNLFLKSAHKMLWSINSSSDGYFHNSLNNAQNTYQPGNKDKFNKGFWIYAQTVDTICKTVYDSAYFNINAVPKPDFISHIVEGQNPLNVQFSDSSKIEYGNISKWNWDFGDGNTSTLQNPVHQYTTSGKFDIKLKVISDSLCSDSIRKNAMIYVWPLSLNEEGNVKLMVYPNPANNQLIVKVQSQGITITHFVLCNFIGAKVMELNNINMNQTIIDRNHLAAGLYFLKVDDSAGNRHVFQVVFE